MMKILITGASGLLGEKVTELALQQGLQVYGSHNDGPTNLENSISLDLTDKDAVLSVSKEVKPDIIINCAGISDVDLCERDEDLAMEVNAEAPLYLAEASNTVGAHLIHVSTDYVFDGKKGMYSEDDRPNPINVYGHSKLLGEKNVASTARSWCVARTSVLFGWGREKRPNYATWIIRGLREEERLNVVTDQYASPTLNTNLAAMLLEVAEHKLQGTIHLAGGDRIDRFTMAIKIADVFNLDKSFLTPVGSGSVNWLARRPKDSSLNVSKVTEELDAKPMGVDKALTEMRMTENRE